MTDQSSENLRTLPQDSESFGNVPNNSEMFRRFPNTSERKENHILTAREVTKMFETAGVARTERSIINWCHPDRHSVSRLDCFYDTNERKYFITPQSVELAIKEEQAKIRAGSEASPSESELPKPSEPPPRPRSSETPPPSHDTQPDFIKTLRAKVRRLTLQTEVDKRYIEKLETERQNFIEQMLQQSREIGMLETEVRHYKELPAPRQQRSDNNHAVAGDGIRQPIEVESEPTLAPESPLDSTP